MYFLYLCNAHLIIQICEFARYKKENDYYNY